MSRRGRAGPTISLFAFQDIITSVTAIVTVITLLLALDLVQRKRTQPSRASAQLVADLTNWLKSAEAEAARLQSTVSQTDQLVREAAAASPTELRDELAARTAEIERMKQERARLQALALQLESDLKQAQLAAFDLEPLRAAAEDQEREAEALKEQRLSESADERPVFALPKGFQKEGWLAILEAQTIHLAPLGRPARPITLTASNVPLVGSSAAQELQRWIDREQHPSLYLLLLVRPGGEQTLDDVETLLSQRDVSFGYDLIGAEEVLLHPERGAAP